MWPDRIDPAALKARDVGAVGKLAADLLALGGVYRPPTPDNLISLVDPGRRVKLERRPLARGQHGALHAEGLGWLIQVNEIDHALVQRFTVFHEGFHIIRRRRRLFPEDDFRYLEWLAQHFARQVLIPRAWLISALTETTDSWRLARRFQVPWPVMKERLKEVGR